MLKTFQWSIALALLLLLAACGSSEETDGAGGKAGGDAASSSGTAGSGGSAGAGAMNAGAGGTGGTGAGGSGMGGNPNPDCLGPADCKLVNNCCTCLAIPADAPPPICRLSECLIPACQSQGNPTPTVECVNGICTVGPTQ